MIWIGFALVGAVVAVATWMAGRWWFGRQLEALRQRLDGASPAVPNRPLSLGDEPPADGSTASGDGYLDRLEQLLCESEARWHKPRPFLDTAPLAHTGEEPAEAEEHGKR